MEDLFGCRAALIALPPHGQHDNGPGGTPERLAFLAMRDGQTA